MKSKLKHIFAFERWEMLFLTLNKSSQIYRLHGFIPNSCKICYFMGLYCLNTNVMHDSNMEIMCMTFVCKQHK